MLFGFSLSLVLVAFKICASKPLVRDGLDTPVLCLGNPTSNITNYQNSEWSSYNIYPIQVCATFSGPVKGCARPANGELRLYIYHQQGVDYLKKEFSPNGSIPHCHIFQACDIAEVLKKKPLDGALVGASAQIFHTQGMTGKETTFKVLLRAIYYYPDQPVMTAITDGGHNLHSVVCYSPGCQIVAQSPDLAPTSVQHFSIKHGQAPECLKGDIIHEGTFSVTTFICQEHCPKQYIIQDKKSEELNGGEPRNLQAENQIPLSGGEGEVGSTTKEPGAEGGEEDIKKPLSGEGEGEGGEGIPSGEPGATAPPISRYGAVTSVACLGDPISDISEHEDIGWDSKNVYSMRVCAEFSGAVKGCDDDSYGELKLYIYYKDGVESLSILYFPTDNSRRCHVFHACEIAIKMAGKPLEGLKVGASAQILNTQGTTEDEITFQVSMRAVSYVVDEARDVPAVSTDKSQILHSVICHNVPNCQVVAKSPHIEPSSIYQFKVIDGQAPDCVKSGVLTETEGTFSVTTFICQKSCPETYTVSTKKEKKEKQEEGD